MITPNEQIAAPCALKLPQPSPVPRTFSMSIKATNGERFSYEMRASSMAIAISQALRDFRRAGLEPMNICCGRLL